MLMKIQVNRFFIASLILGIAIACFSYLGKTKGILIVTEYNLHTLPHQIGNWVGEEKPFQDYVYKALGADENVNRQYKTPDGRSLWLYIGYYGTAKGGHPQHTPQGCYPGAGWGIEGISPLSIKIDEKETITVNNLFARRGDQTEQTIYWLQNSYGTVMNTGLEQNLEKLRCKILFNRADGAFIRVSSPVFNNNREETIEYQKEFVKELFPLLPNHWPKEDLK